MMKYFPEDRNPRPKARSPSVTSKSTMASGRAAVMRSATRDMAPTSWNE